MPLISLQLSLSRIHTHTHTHTHTLTHTHIYICMRVVALGRAPQGWLEPSVHEAAPQPLPLLPSLERKTSGREKLFR